MLTKIRSFFFFFFWGGGGRPVGASGLGDLVGGSGWM